MSTLISTDRPRREARVVCLPGQLRLLQSPAAHVLSVAGVGAGKSEGGARYALHRILTQPGAVGFVGVQTYNGLTRVALPKLLRLLNDCQLRHVYGKMPPPAWGASRYPEHVGILSVRVPGAARPAQVVTGSMENFEAHRGLEIGWYWLDEARNMVAEAYDVILARLRGQPPGTCYGGALTTTPNGFGWIYKKFLEEPMADSAVVRSKLSENPYLPPGYEASLRSHYTKRFARQELDAEFMNLTSGQMFYAFRRGDHASARVVVDPKQGMWYAMDFNVSPLCAVYGQGDKKGCRVAGEVYVQGSGRTADAVDEFCRRFESHETKRVTVYGDQSGANRDTRSATTDYEVIETAFRAHRWTVDLRRNYRNPPLVDSVEAVNAALEHGRIAIDPSAAHLVKDLEQVSWVEGTRKPDKSNPELTHCFAAGTLVETDRGPTPIERLPESGNVLTLGGFAPYCAAGMTRRNAALVELSFENGVTIRCTPDHRFLVDSDTWRYAYELAGQEVVCIQAPPSSARPSSSGAARDTTSAGSTFRAGIGGLASIASFGSTLTGAFRRGCTSTIRTAIERIIASTTWSASAVGSTWPGTSASEASWGGGPFSSRSSTRRNGTDRPRVDGGTGSTTRRTAGNSTPGRSTRSAPFAESGTRPSRRAAGSRSSAISTAGRLRCVGVERLSERADVYCLTVPSTECFAIEGGLVAHNCADALRYHVAMEYPLPGRKATTADWL